MSQLAIRNSLLAAVIQVVETDLGLQLACENKDFDDTGLDAFCSFSFNPATSGSLGKTVQSSDDERGFIQVSVFINKNSNDYDNLQLSIIDELKKTFYNGAVIGVASIMEVTFNSGYVVESRFKRDLTINYTSYTARG